MMGFADRINAAILRRARPAAAVEDRESIVLSFGEAKRIVAMRNDDYVGDSLILLAELPDGRVRQIDEHDVRWSEVLAALDADGRTSMSSTEWRLRLIGNPERRPITLFPG